MKEFKKWLSGHDQKLADCLNKEEKGFELGLKLGWKAALEWQLKLIKQYQDGLLFVGDIQRIIEKELEE